MCLTLSVYVMIIIYCDVQYTMIEQNKVSLTQQEICELHSLICRFEAEYSIPCVYVFMLLCEILSDLNNCGRNIYER